VKSPQPYLLNHADLHVHAVYDATVQNLANLYIHTRSFKPDTDCAHPWQVAVRLFSRLRHSKCPFGRYVVTTYLTHDYVHCLTAAVTHID